MVAVGVEEKTYVHEVQMLAEQMELAASKTANNTAVLQINENVATVTHNALKLLEEKVAAHTGGGLRRNALLPNPNQRQNPPFPHDQGTPGRKQEQPHADPGPEEEE